MRPRVALIIWHLLKDPEARFADLGPDHYARKTDRDKKIRSHIRQMEAPGVDVTITPRAAGRGSAVLATRG